MNTKKILVIEDDISIKDNITDLLEVNGYKVFSAVNGYDGLELASEIIPDLILCDVMMPKLDGFEVKKRISNDQTLARIPFIFLTAKTEYSDLRKGMNLGAEDYITKPFENKELIDAVKVRLNKYDELMNTAKDTVGVYDKNEKKRNKKILVKIGVTQKFIDYTKVVFIKSLGNYTQIYTEEKEKITVRKLLKEWEVILPDDEFFRIHQSYIINLSYVKKIEPFSKHSYLAKMKIYDDSLPVSARYSQKLKSKFSL